MSDEIPINPGITAEDNTSDTLITNPLEFQNKLIEPEAQKSYSEITRDFQLGNLSEDETNTIRISFCFISHIQLLESKGKVLEGLTYHFYEKPNVMCVTSLSKQGFLRRRINERVITQNVRNKNELDATQTIPIFNRKRQDIYGGDMY